MYRAVPALEMLQDKWERMSRNRRFEPVHSAIHAGLKNVRKWYKKMDDTDVYVVTMGMRLKLASYAVSNITI
jgi:hypothetical protein